MINTTKNYSRKDFLNLSSCSALAVTVSGIAGCVSQNSSKHIPLGMQLYSVRQELAEATGGIEWYILEYEIEGAPPNLLSLLSIQNSTLSRIRDYFL